MPAIRPAVGGGTADGAGPRKTYDAFISYAHDGDGEFALAVRRGLQHLAKPWNRRRAMDVFLDETSMSASAGLRPSIRSALDSSRWFILLASPESRKSPWVTEEITYWASNRDPNHLLVVITSGSWEWDTDSGDISSAATAANPALRGVFTEQPRRLMQNAP